jgi:hypothetical protein
VVVGELGSADLDFDSSPGSVARGIAGDISDAVLASKLAGDFSDNAMDIVNLLGKKCLAASFFRNSI